MPTLQAETPSQPIALEPPRKLWTRAECEMLESYGILEQEHLELVEGELINKMGKKRPHSNSMLAIFTWLQ